MKEQRIYIVVDKIAERIIGSFVAHSKEMATKIFKESIVTNEKLKYSEEQYGCYVSPYSFTEFETYDEVLNNCSVMDF